MDTKTRIVKGESGRSLKIPESWKINKNNEFHVGLLRAYDVFPKVLVRRLDRERTKKFDEIHTKKLDNLRAEIENMQTLLKSENNDNNSLSSKNTDESSVSTNNSEPTMDLKTRIEDTKNLLSQVCQEYVYPCTVS